MSLFRCTPHRQFHRQFKNRQNLQFAAKPPPVASPYTGDWRTDGRQGFRQSPPVHRQFTASSKWCLILEFEPALRLRFPSRYDVFSQLSFTIVPPFNRKYFIPDPRVYDVLELGEVLLAAPPLPRLHDKSEGRREGVADPLRRPHVGPVFAVLG